MDVTIIKVIEKSNRKIATAVKFPDGMYEIFYQDSEDYVRVSEENYKFLFEEILYKSNVNMFSALTFILRSNLTKPISL